MSLVNGKQKIDFFNSIAADRERWKRKNSYYHRSLEKIMKFIIPEGSSVLEIGCGTGELLNAVKPGNGVGIDFSKNMINIASNKFPHIKFIEMDAENLNLVEKFDYIIMSDLIGHLEDVQNTFKSLSKVCHKKTKIIITYYNYLWEPMLRLGELLKLKMKQYYQNWLSYSDIINLLNLSNFETVRSNTYLLFPKFIPLFSEFLNKYLSKLFLLRNLCLVNLIIARPKPNNINYEYSCSVIIPARNEAANIEKAVLEIPEM